MKIAIVGIGGTGSAAARHLAKAGHEVIGFEQFRLGHDRGSSHGESRVIRYTYPDRLYTEMMGDAYPLWDELAAEAGEELLVRCGGLYFGQPTNANIIETEDALSASGIVYEKLGLEAIQERYPAVRLNPGEIGIYQSDMGFLRANVCVLANARLARQHGATLHEETPVQEIISRGNETVIRTEAGAEFAADRVIVTAGAWMSKLFARLDLPLCVSRQQFVYLKPARHPENFAVGRLPVWIDAATNYYGFPSDGRIEGVKIACHNTGDTVDPDVLRRESDASYQQETIAYVASRLPDLSGEVTHAKICLYTNTPDEDFIIDRDPSNANVWIISGCSGHGFKFTVLLGKIAAGLATEEPYARDLSRFLLNRFDGKDRSAMTFANSL